MAKGRPRKSPDLRSAFLRVRLTEAERTRLLAAAAKAKQRPTTFVRTALGFAP